MEQIQCVAGDASWRDAPSLAQDDDLALAARNDLSAFEPLYLRYRVAVFRYLKTRTRDGDEAADLTALTFERAIAGISGYRPGGTGVRGWLFAIARNASVDLSRRRRLARVQPGAPESVEGPEVRIVADEAAAELRGRVAALPWDQRSAIVLRFAGGMTAKEIGSMLGKTEAASQKLVSRGLAALKEAYRVR